MRAHAPRSLSQRLLEIRFFVCFIFLFFFLFSIAHCAFSSILFVLFFFFLNFIDVLWFCATVDDLISFYLYLLRVLMMSSSNPMMMIGGFHLQFYEFAKSLKHHKITQTQQHNTLWLGSLIHFNRNHVNFLSACVWALLEKHLNSKMSLGCVFACLLPACLTRLRVAISSSFAFSIVSQRRIIISPFIIMVARWNFSWCWSRFHGVFFLSLLFSLIDRNYIEWYVSLSMYIWNHRNKTKYKSDFSI